MKTAMRIGLVLYLAVVLAQSVSAQTKGTPDISGAWGPYRGGRGSDPKLAAPPASPLVLKPEYAKPYEERRKAEAEASNRGEPLGTAAVLCVPYGVPTMM